MFTFVKLLILGPMILLSSSLPYFSHYSRHSSSLLPLSRLQGVPVRASKN